MKNLFVLFVCSLLVTNLARAEELRIVSVRGEGEVKIKPDMARLDLQVHSMAKTAKASQEKNAVEMSRVQKVLSSEFGVPTKEIQTSGFQLNPDYRYENNGKQVFLGYRTMHSLNITVKNLEKLGPILDKVVGKGAEDVGVSLGGVSFDSDKRKDYELQALELAMKNAQFRADALARFSKKNIKGVRRISDSSVSYQPFRPMAPGGAMLMEAKSADSATPIAAGEIAVNSSVAVDFDLD